MKLSSTNRQRNLRVNRPAREYKGGRRLPIEPLREFIEELIAQEEADDDGRGVTLGVVDPRLGAVARVACLVGIDEKTLWRWRNTSTYVLEGVADAALTNEGSRHLGDLWPAIYWPEAA